MGGLKMIDRLLVSRDKEDERSAAQQESPSALETLGRTLVNPYTWRLWSNGSQLELMDASFRENYQTDEVTKCIHIALLCVQEEAEDRPTMQDIDQMLTTSSIALTLPRPPGFFFRSKHEQVGGVHPYMDSVDESSITQVAPR
ncbi:unnamed protein product [Brassica oleracea var. botrytis]|uniref:(rape) hypothetical protein n=1 Tax=Brassica napus TaxID=3708 RepID=A0A816RGJ7_BRANA|nr:unnamed protein product [Brassica napus]